MAGSSDGGTLREIVCPHCKKTFRAELISGSTSRHQGFKCPHCRLFVPRARADERTPAEPRT